MEVAIFVSRYMYLVKYELILIPAHVFTACILPTSPYKQYMSLSNKILFESKNS